MSMDLLHCMSRQLALKSQAGPRLDGLLSGGTADYE
jgi:hypothetical protein